MRSLLRSVTLGAIVAAAAAATLADVVVLKGGTVVQLKEPWVRRGNTAYLTRADGTLLSVPVGEIDRQATATANQAAPAAAPADAGPASTPAEAARAAVDPSTPKARVKITDADVSHPLDLEAAAGDKSEKKDASATAGAPRIEVANYTREMRAGLLVVKGTLRNPGQGTANDVRLLVSALDEKGQPIDGTTASLSNGAVEAGQSIEFAATINAGERTVGTVRFEPQWTQPPPVPTPVPRTAGSAPGAAPAAAAPAPRPTPFGRGNIYAAPVPNAPSQAPADGKTGYIPGATSPDNQPKPPSR